MGAFNPPSVVIVGAGISGLALGQALRERGQMPLLLERSRGVGGRCATRRVAGWPVDHGLPFLHGRDTEFLAALDAVSDATPIHGWPHRRIGGGLPCQPEAFEGEDRLLAFREGLTRFPKQLARNLAIRLDSKVRSLRQAPGEARLALTLESGEEILAGVVALTMPAPSALELIAASGLDRESPAVAGARPVLEQIRTIPCLAVIARYSDDAPVPDWDACYPTTSSMVHVVLHDSTKRAPGAPRTLVVQGRPRFSREFLGKPPAEWAKELLWEAGEFVGSWMEHPVERQEHVWRNARVDTTSELAAPLAIRLENGAILAFCGDGFSPAGGAEGAFRSGRSLAARIETLHETPARAS
ncbi:MAG TPA: FAD-dependent oxidoreductase [Candidatus Eisenbacteria bacterium]|nr:FAD-dependent oxidoreductase [Candidatus Eisenbacteria bacterium]